MIPDDVFQQAYDAYVSRQQQQAAAQYQQSVANAKLQHQLQQAMSPYLQQGLGNYSTPYKPPSARDILNDIHHQLSNVRAAAVTLERLQALVADFAERAELGAAVAAHVSPEWYARYEAERERVKRGD